MLQRRLLLSAGLTTLVAPALHAQPAGPWPQRAVRVVVPWPPGGSTDVLARLLCERMQAATGQNFLIENRPGAGGNIGVEALAKSTPDGYTMGPVTVSGWSINQYLYRRLAYDPERDITPISMHWELPNVLVVSTQHVQARTLQEFVAWAKARPQGISYGSPGVGTTAHLSGSMFCGRLGIDGTHVPFRGAAQIIPAMLSGDLTCALDNLTSYIPLIREGRATALAITSAERWPTLPNILTMAEAGVPDFVVTSWCAMAFPGGVPRPALDGANAVMKAVVETPEFQNTVLQSGARALWTTPEGAAERAARERPMWREVVKSSGATLD